MLEQLKKLCALNGTSGDEKDVRDYIVSNISGCDIKTDNLGNLIVFKKGSNTPKNKIMICAHMDEVGFIASYITDDGYIKIKPVGGISASAVLGRQICFKSGAVGIIGSRPVHKLKDEEKETQPKIEDLYVDIGAKTKEEAQTKVALGDNAYFTGGFSEFGDNLVCAKAIDDRMGCAVMLDMISGDLQYDTYFVFTTAEEVGTRGAAAAVYRIMPDFAIVLEATTACDIAGVKGGDRVCRLGEGTVISFMDNGTIYDKELYDTAFFTAKENNLKCQTKTKIAGGNDSGIIHKSLGGVRTIALSVPCRYLHTASCVINTADFSELRVFAEKMLGKTAML